MGWDGEREGMKWHLSFYGHFKIHEPFPTPDVVVAPSFDKLRLLRIQGTTHTPGQLQQREPAITLVRITGANITEDAGARLD